MPVEWTDSQRSLKPPNATSQPIRKGASESAAADCAALRLTELRLTDLRLSGLRLFALRLAALPRIILQLARLQLTTLQLTTLRKQVWLKVMAVLCRGLFLELQRHNYWSKEPCVQRLTKISPQSPPKGLHPSKVHEPEVIVMMILMMIMMVLN